MTATVALPQARIPLGWAMVQGQRIPVEIDMEWMLVLARLLERTGGTSGDTNFTQYINQFFDIPYTDNAGQEAIRAVDELRNELAIAKGEVQTLRAQIEELTAQLAQGSAQVDVRSRIEQLEDRFI
jgi:TolA-binding protein